MAIIIFYGMSDTVVLSDNILDIALGIKNPRWPSFVQVQAINSYHFWYNRRRIVFLVSIMGFSGMPYIVMLSENTLDIALWVKHSRWPPSVQGQAINSYYFQHNRGSFVFFGVYHGVFGYAVHNGVGKRYFRHCSVGEKSKMAAICSRSSNKFILFST